MLDNFLTKEEETSSDIDGILSNKSMNECVSNKEALRKIEKTKKETTEISGNKSRIYHSPVILKTREAE